MKQPYLFYFACCFVAFLTSCTKDEKTPLDIPTAYDGTAFAANTVTQDAVRAQLEALVAEAQKGRTAGTILDYATLSGLYSAGAPSLKSINYCHSVISTMSATGV